MKYCHHGADYPDVTVFKLSGKLLQSESLLSEILLVIKSWCQSTGQQAVLVHGGGLYCDHWCNVFQLPNNKRNGMRVTDPQQLPVIAGALAGYAHTKVLSACKQAMIEPVGMTPTTADTLSCQLHTEHTVLGRVGDVSANDPTLTFQLLAQGFWPVFHSLATDQNGECLNVNADDIAVALADCLSASKLVLLSDTNGLLDAKGQTIRAITVDQIKSLTEQQWVSKGMIAKLLAITELFSTEGGKVAQRPSNVSEVIIASGLSPHLLKDALQGSGQATTIKMMANVHPWQQAEQVEIKSQMNIKEAQT